MAQKSEKMLVLGATGQQGGATARALAADGWRVRALVRDKRSSKAQGKIVLAGFCPAPCRFQSACEPA